MPARFDPRAAWAAMTEEHRAAVGEAALLLFASAEAADISPTEMSREVGKRWEHAHQEAWRLLGEAADIDATEYPDGPDLAAIDVRACRGCGCTQHSACDGGCWRVEPDLCSSCSCRAPSEDRQSEPAEVVP